jgi:integrase
LACYPVSRRFVLLPRFCYPPCYPALGVADDKQENRMARFTDKFIAALRPKAERYEKWEGGGFGVRVSPRGKAWVWVYRHQGRPRRMTLGSYPAMGLADARIKLAEARKLLERGIDPGDVEVQQRKAERVAETVEELAEAYLEKWARPRKRSAAEDERILRKDVIPAWRRRKAKDIARRDVIALLDAIVDRGSPIAANRTLAVIRRMFGWALSRDIVPASPCVAVKAPAKERRRDRVLSADEIAALWRAFDNPELAMSLAIRLALKLQLVTAQRKGEIIGAERSEFDRDGRVWTIPAEKAKNGMPHRVPLSPLARALLDEIEVATGRRPDHGKEGPSRWLFPSPRRDGPITGPAVDHAMRDNRGILGTGDATPHDLRRTAASHMTSIGISRLVVSKILNHAEPGVTAVYDRHSYDIEKRAALVAWGARLEEIIGDRAERGNVVRLPAAEPAASLATAS